MCTHHTSTTKNLQHIMQIYKQIQILQSIPLASSPVPIIIVASLYYYYYHHHYHYPVYHLYFSLAVVQKTHLFHMIDIYVVARVGCYPSKKTQIFNWIELYITTHTHTYRTPCHSNNIQLKPINMETSSCATEHAPETLIGSSR